MPPDPSGATEPFGVLFVCTGNICRSPTAEAVLRLLGADHPAVELEVRSRGVHDWNVGRRAHPAMTRVAAERGYDLSAHTAAQVSADDLAWLLPGRAPERVAECWLARGPALVVVTLGPGGLGGGSGGIGSVRCRASPS